MCVRLCSTCSSVLVMSRVYTSFIESITLYLQFRTPLLWGVYSSFPLWYDLPTRGMYLVADVDNKIVKYLGEGSISWRGLDQVNIAEEDTIAFLNCLKLRITSWTRYCIRGCWNKIRSVGVKKIYLRHKEHLFASYLIFKKGSRAKRAVEFYLLWPVHRAVKRSYKRLSCGGWHEGAGIHLWQKWDLLLELIFIVLPIAVMHSVLLGNS